VKSARLRWTRTPHNIMRTIYACQRLRLTRAQIGTPAAVTDFPQGSTPVANIKGYIAGNNVLGDGYTFKPGTTTIHWVATNEMGCTKSWNQKVVIQVKDCPPARNHPMVDSDVTDK
jgi:hypothetical protein